MSLPRHALAQQSEEIHAALFISGAARRGAQFNNWVETWCRSYAMANQTYVICAQSVASEAEISKFDLLGPGGGSSIIAPDGSYLAEPLLGREGDVIAEIDRRQGMRFYSLFDTVGYHGRPDIFDLQVKRNRASTASPEFMQAPVSLLEIPV
jgi:predicted amidohydrolase